MSVNIHFDTGSLSSEEATGLSAFIAAVQPALLSTAQLREYNRGLYGSTAAVIDGHKTVVAEPRTATEIAELDKNAERRVVETQAAADEPTGVTAADTPKRERGKPAPGRARRTKEEIAEDEAADAADAAAASDQPQNIQTGGERINPEEAAQDATDEAAEDAANADPEKPLTLDDVKNAVGLYVTRFGEGDFEKGRQIASEDGPGLFVDVLGAPPAGEAFWKFSILPTDQDKLAAMVKAWTDAASAGARHKRKGA